MNLKPDQKSAIVIAVLAMFILGGMTLLSHPKVRYQDTTDYNKLQQQDQAQTDAYNKYLQSLQTDPAASKDLFQNLISQDEVKQQVEAALDVKQKIVMPALADNQITVAQDSGRTPALNYLGAVAQAVDKYNNTILNTSKNLFAPNQDPGMIGQALTQTDTLVAELKHTPVPPDLVKFHKAQILAFQTYRDLISRAQQHNLNEDVAPWPAVYRDYDIVNAQAAIVDDEFSAIDKKYQVSAVGVPVADEASRTQKLPAFINTAQAQTGSVVVIGNVPDAIKEGIKQGLASAFAGFITEFLDNSLTAIQRDLSISNFFKYGQSLANGQYLGDYLNQYVPDAVDQSIVRKLIPALNCGSNPADLQKIYQAKAQQYLGFDPAAVNPTDPNFYDKMAKTGDFFASPQGWELYYQDVASAAQAQAQHAADLEIVSPGLKSVRDRVTNEITTSLSSINNAQAAAYIAFLDLGVVNVENIVSKLVSSITTNLFNKFIFTGVVYKDNTACIAVAQLTPIIPVSSTPYKPPSSK
jgi:hypothetical protein